MKITYVLSPTKHIKSAFIKLKNVKTPCPRPVTIINKREFMKSLFNQKNLFVHSKTCLYCDDSKYTRCLECYGNGRTYINIKEFLCDGCTGSGRSKCLYC
jgi:hypothetical protein